MRCLPGAAGLDLGALSTAFDVREVSGSAVTDVLLLARSNRRYWRNFGERPSASALTAIVEDVPGVKKCTIELSFETPWDASMLSDEARLALGMDDWDTPEVRPDPGEGPDYSKAPNT